MSENLIQQNQSERPVEEENLKAKQLLTDTFEGMGSVKEISENLEATARVATELIDTLKLDEEFFGDKTRVTLFALAANKAARSQDYGTKENAADIALILGKDHSTETEGLDRVLTAEAEKGISDTERLAIYDKYTNKKLSKRLETAIKGDLIKDTRERLGLDSPDEDDPFTVRVLSISEDYNLYGISPGTYEEIIAESRLEGAEAMKYQENIARDTAAWSKGLKQRYDSFFEEQGMEPFHGAAWVTTLEGETQLCVMQPTAEKVLDRADVAKNSNLYSDEAWDSDRHLIAHEFVHTQGILSRNGLGLSLEELRAEELAHGSAGYNGIKTFITDIRLVTGVDVRNIIEDVFNGGGNGNEVYVKLAEELGVDTTLDIVSVLPDAYMNDEDGISELRRSVSAATGGLNEIIEGLYRTALANGQEKDIAARIERAADVYESFDDPDTILRMRSSYGLEFSAGKIREELEARKAA